MDAAQERLAQLSRTQQALLAKIKALEEQEKGEPAARSGGRDAPIRPALDGAAERGAAQPTARRTLPPSIQRRLRPTPL